MYAPPALGYALIVWRYENTKATSKSTMPSDSGSSAPNAAAATTGSMTLSISSVAYATDERASLANTASAVELPSRSWISWSVRSFWPEQNVTLHRFGGRTAVRRGFGDRWLGRWRRRGRCNPPGGWRCLYADPGDIAHAHIVRAAA